MEPKHQKLFLASFLFILVRVLKPLWIQLCLSVVLDITPINLIVSYREPKGLQVNADLVCAARLGVAFDNRVFSVFRQLLKLEDRHSVFCLAQVFKLNLVFGF